MSLRRVLDCFGFGNVDLNGSESQLWESAARRTPFSYRWLGRSLTVADVDAEHAAYPAWQVLHASIRLWDRICPFVINPNSMAMRKGYVVIRDGVPIGGTVTISS